MSDLTKASTDLSGTLAKSSASTPGKSSMSDEKLVTHKIWAPSTVAAADAAPTPTDADADPACPSCCDCVSSIQDQIRKLMSRMNRLELLIARQNSDCWKCNKQSRALMTELCDEVPRCESADDQVAVQMD